MVNKEISGWQKIVYDLIVDKFSIGTFSLEDLYEFQEYFLNLYPDNFHI